MSRQSSRLLMDADVLSDELTLRTAYFDAFDGPRTSERSSKKLAPSVPSDGSQAANRANFR
jgi:hypothetical protein